MTKVRHDVACVVAFRLNAITDAQFRVERKTDDLSVVLFTVGDTFEDVEVYIDRDGLTPWDKQFTANGEDNDG
jgi:hypothetical protein